MKSLYYILLLIVSLLFTGCSDNDGQEDFASVDLSLENTKVFLNPEKSITVKITGGNGAYKVTTSDDKAARASITDDVITITAGQVVDKANAMIVVVDKMYKRAVINVNVAREFEMALSESNVSLIAGEKGEDEAILFIETGNFGYILDLIGDADKYIEVDQSNLETAGKFIVKAIAAGSAQIKITDAIGKEAMLDITIKAAEALEVDKASLTFDAVQGTQDLIVKNGNGGYKMVFEDSSVAKMAYATEGGVITVIGKKNGETIAYIEDRKGLKSNPITIIVDGPEYAMQFGEKYYGFANFRDVERIDPSMTKSKQVTLEMMCCMTGYRGYQTFMGLSDNLLLLGLNDGYKPTHPIVISGNNLEIESSVSFNLNEWMHIALVVDCEKIDVKEKYKLYINGVGDDNMNFKNTWGTHNEINLASSSDDNKFVVGWASNQYWRWMLGNVSEVRIWKAARTQKQIIDNMCELTDTDAPELFARWDFSAGVETDYIQDTGNSGYETNLVLSEIKHNDKHYGPISLPMDVYVDKGCP